MTSGHLVAYRKLTLHRDENFDHLDHPWRQFVTLLQLGDLLVIDIREDVDLTFGSLFVLAYLVRDIDLAGSNFCLSKKFAIDLFQDITRKCCAFLEDNLTVLNQVGLQLASIEEFVYTLVTLFLKDTNFVLKIAAKCVFFHSLDV